MDIINMSIYKANWICWTVNGIQTKKNYCLSSLCWIIILNPT